MTMEHSLLKEPQNELWEVPCKEEASLEFFLPLMATGEKGRRRGTGRLPLEHSDKSS